MKISFVKMHGLGNDYLIIDSAPPVSRSQFSRMARHICDRHSGIGADGILLFQNRIQNRFGMIIYNSDGSSAEMCGNGIRCLARFIYETGYSRELCQEIRTPAGIVRTQIIKTGSPEKAFEICVDMGVPEFLARRIPMRFNKPACINESIKIGKQVFRITAVSVGNPHAVVFVSEFPVDWIQNAQLIAGSRLFPKGVNVEFACLAGSANNRYMHLRVWERGAGATLACGTGACAATAAALINGYTGRKVPVFLPGGRLVVEWAKQSNHLFLTGPAKRICEGTFDW